MRVLATDINTMLWYKLLAMAPPSARTAVAGTEYKSAELLAVDLDAAMQKNRLTLSVASLPSSPAADDIDTDICTIKQTKHSKSRQQSRGNSAQQILNCAICFYHDRFGYKAEECAGLPCKFAGLMQQENSTVSN